MLKPQSEFNLVKLSDGALGYSVGKVLSEPELCDFICFQSYCYLISFNGKNSSVLSWCKRAERKRCRFMIALKNDHYTYRVTWSEEDKEYVGLCAGFSSLSWLAGTPEAALKGIRKVVADVVEDMFGQ